MINWDDPLAPITHADSDDNLLMDEANEIQEDKKQVDESAELLSIEPINPDHKRVVNGQTDINQLAPFKYPWAWDYFLNANKNHWTPLDINMTQDIADYNQKLTIEEKHVYDNVLAYLTTSDILAMRNIGLAVMEKMTAPELQIYQARQVYEEALHCYIDGTQVLSENGFIDFKDIKKRTKIAQYNEDGSIEFVNHLGITADDYTGDMISFKSAVYNSCVTPNHRCVSINERDNNKLEIIVAEKLSPSNRKFPVAGCVQDTKKQKFSDIDKLKIAYQADGTICNDGNKLKDGTIMYRWHFKKQRKIDRLLNILQDLKLKNKISDNEYIYAWVPANYNLGKDFSFVDLTNISYNYARNFINELTLWDGSQSSQMLRYSSTNESCINITSAVATLANYRTGEHKTKTKTDTDYWTLNFVDKNYTSGRSIKKTYQKYRGKVYSVGVPSTMIITKYQGKICISGNTWTYQHCIESLGLDQAEVYNRYRVVPQINKKIQITNRRLASILRADIDLKDRKELENFVMAYIFFAGIFEGVWFYNGFSPIFALQRRGIMKGTAEQFQYIMRDEVMHCSFGIKVVRQIIKEENIKLDQKLLDEMFAESLEAESAYANYLLPEPMIGYSAQNHIDQFKYICNRRARQLEIKEPYDDAINALPWLDEQANLRKEKNFFETRVTEYQTGGALKWE